MTSRGPKPVAGSLLILACAALAVLVAATADPEVQGAAGAAGSPIEPASAAALEPTSASAAETRAADDPASVLVVANAASAVSLRLAAAYATARSIPPGNMVRIEAPLAEEIDRQTFEADILTPLQDHLWRSRTVERIVYIVLMKGVPLKISGSDGAAGNRASVDSEIALLYRRIVTGPYTLHGRMPNPYFGADPGFTGRLHIVPPAVGAPVQAPVRPWGLYLVTRLDAFTEDEVRALIARSEIARGSKGRFVFDLRGSGDGDAWMRLAAASLRARGAEVVEESTEAFLAGERNVLGFCSWGSNDAHYPGRGPRHDWAPGAIAAGFVSSDARTFREPAPGWKPGSWRDPGSFFEGTPQSLLADFVREGVTGGIGNAYEPYLDACVRPQILFPAYLAGYNLAEASYLSLPFLSWQAVVIGDPLCRIATP